MIARSSSLHDLSRNSNVVHCKSVARPHLLARRPNVSSFIQTQCFQEALRDLIFAATHCLADLEAFELRMVEVERLILAGFPMGKTECFRLGPGFEGHLALPYCV
jgi:hypothetical protein